jgi:hypothetical protein
MNVFFLVIPVLTVSSLVCVDGDEIRVDSRSDGRFLATVGLKKLERISLKIIKIKY